MLTFLLYYRGMYVISGENAADLDSIIKISLDLQAAEGTRRTYICLSPPSEH